MVDGQGKYGCAAYYADERAGCGEYCLTFARDGWGTGGNFSGRQEEFEPPESCPT